MKDIDGNNITLSDYRGKIVILNFWATWCPYCIEELPDFDALNTEYAKSGEIVILAVDSQESPETVKDFLKENKTGLTVLLDEDGAVTGQYGIEGFPTTFVLNRDGSLNTYKVGKTDKEYLGKVISSILSAEGARH
ncbi:MAG: TlpA family protein disulfide reductase [Clostridiales bacterium]|nr:TlpA family protein disulfide reductase [Clostridiales bacterium]